MRKDEAELSGSEFAENNGNEIPTRLPKSDRGPRPDSLREETAFMKLESMHQKMNRCNRKLYALQKKQEPLKIALSQTPGDIFHRKERKSIQANVDGLQLQIDQTRMELETIPLMYGFDNVGAAEKAYRNAKLALDAVKRKQAEWDGVTVQETKTAMFRDKVSVLKQLAAKQLELQEKENGGRECGRNGVKYGREEHGRL